MKIPNFSSQNRTFVPNRVISHEQPKIIKPGETFLFEGKFYSNEDESIVLKSSLAFGKIFKPI